MLNRDDGVVKAPHQDKVVERLLRNHSSRDWIILEVNCCTTSFLCRSEEVLCYFERIFIRIELFLLHRLLVCINILFLNIYAFKLKRGKFFPALRACGFWTLPCSRLCAGALGFT